MNKQILLTSVFITACASSLSAQTIINGTFNGLVGASSEFETEIGKAQASDQTVQGWNSINTGIISSISGYGSGNAAWIKGGKNSDTSSISQTINFLSAGNYQLTFDSFGEPFVFEQIARYGVTLEGKSAVLRQGLTESTIGRDVTNHSYDFTIADAGNYNLKFANLSDFGDVSYVDVAIDNVSISTVPEPSSVALLGLGVLSLVVRRKR